MNAVRLESHIILPSRTDPRPIQKRSVRNNVARTYIYKRKSRFHSVPYLRLYQTVRALGTDQMYWNAVLLMAWSLATVTAILDSTRSQHYWEDAKPEEVPRYQNDNMLKTYVFRGGNKQFVTSVFPEMDARGFHEYVFDGLQPDFQWPSIKFKRNYYPQGITSRGFSDDIFHQSFGMFEPLKRSVSRTSPSVANLLRRLYPSSGDGGGGGIRLRQPEHTPISVAAKRRPEMDANGFHGDSFTGGFDRFDTMKRRPEMDETGFEGDSFTGFGGFETMKREDRGGGGDYKNAPHSATRPKSTTHAGRLFGVRQE
ncbi:uncharacterized protein LOC112602311 [Melanaphis sacchari]|uniref:uncharacterized protein LOC112602311 n=1 Tax=Melanaphis sacchari TaxID=742174 RepID=UPI000DC1560A|nr:uncharacterized protein LOC112602311 [Melanaphis sacchari]